MTDRKQFEAMLEALINGDQETAKEVFHNIVVAKSRDIYEELLAEDFSINEAEEEEEEGASDEEGSENPFGGDTDSADSEDDADDADDADSEEDPFDGEDDAEGEEDPFGGEEGGEGLEDRVMDLEDALDELKAEFEELMAQEEGEGHEFDGDVDSADLAGDEMGGGEFDGEMGGEQDELQQFMEYVDKVALPKHGDNGANTKSPVAGKNDMGGTTANIVKGGESKSGGTQGGLLKPSTQEENFGNVNVPGGNAGKTAFKKKEPGHGAEKKGSGESADNKKSLIGSRK